MELISIVIPVYNVEIYLKRCINSVLSQTYKNIQIILVNDGSTDKSGIICDEFAIKDPRINVIHQENGGLSSARNSGIKNALGSYITFLDSDDWIRTDYLEKLYGMIKKYNAEIAVCNFLKTENNDVVSYTDKINIKEMSNREAIQALFSPIQIQMTIACGKLYYRTIFDKLSFPIGRVHEDEFTTYKALYVAKKIVYTEEKLLFYWQRPDSITNALPKLKNRIDALDAFIERLDFLKQEKFEKEIELLIRIILMLCRGIEKNIGSFQDKEHYEEKFKNLKSRFIEMSLIYSRNIITKILIISHKIVPVSTDLFLLIYRKIRKA